jgi:tRNA U34 5-carboxymethylaminomethyl modifying GTPase MnmE/TrmE
MDKDGMEIKELHEFIREIHSKLNTIVERVVASETAFKFQSDVVTQLESRVTHLEQLTNKLELENVKNSLQNKESKRLAKNLDIVTVKQNKNTFITEIFSKVFWLFLGAATAYFFTKII